LARNETTGVIFSDPDRCVGCRTCVSVCPFGNINYSKVGRRVEKCDQCQGEPRCAAVCPSGALTYVDDAKIVQDRRRAFAESFKDVVKEAFK
jgi:Fe-S-cluster-containing hydrogenase component 2